VHLLSSNGTPVLVDGPIYVTVPLATQSTLRHNAYVAAWRFDQKLGKQESSGTVFGNLYLLGGRGDCTFKLINLEKIIKGYKS
jgi:hypothetical protein